MSIIDAFCMTLVRPLADIYFADRAIGFKSREFQVELESGSRYQSVQQLENLTLETGLISCRMLMQFFGVTVSRPDKVTGSARLVMYVPKGIDDDDFKFRDVVIGRGSVVCITPELITDACSGSCLIAGSEVQLSTDLANLLVRANKAAGHLTTIEKQGFGLDAYRAALSVLVFVEDLVYHQCGRQVPSYDHWTHRLLERESLWFHRQIKGQIQRFIRESMYPELQLP